MILLSRFFSKTIKFICHSASHRNSAACLPFIGKNIFVPMANDQINVFHCRFKVQNKHGILLSVHWNLA